MEHACTHSMPHSQICVWRCSYIQHKYKSVCKITTGFMTCVSANDQNQNHFKLTGVCPRSTVSILRFYTEVERRRKMTCWQWQKVVWYKCWCKKKFFFKSDPIKERGNWREDKKHQNWIWDTGCSYWASLTGICSRHEADIYMNTIKTQPVRPLWRFY